MLRPALILPFVAAVLLVAPLVAGQDALTPAETIALPGVQGRIDHMAADDAGNRLFIAALGNGTLEVIDLEKRQPTGTIPGLKEPQGVAYIPSLKRIAVACGGDGSVRTYDAATLTPAGTVTVGDDADNIRLDAAGRFLCVGYGDGGLAILEADSLRKVGDIKLKGHPESFQLESTAARAFVNIPGGFIGGGGSVEVIDLAKREVVARWPLKDAGRNFPLALDEAAHRLYIGCRRPARLLALDTTTGAVVASSECVGDADDIFIDHGRILVIGGDGQVDAFAAEPSRLRRTARIPTAPGARTGLLIPARHTLCVAAQKLGDHPAAIQIFKTPQ